jgi:hypothetical protein
MMISSKPWLLLLLVSAPVLSTGGCGRPAPSQTAADRPLAAFQTQLLDLAFQAATSIPVDPHIKDRSKAQEAVMNVCLDLDQPQRALAYVEKIDNWRRGLGYANLASYFARHDCADRVADYLNRAERISETTDDWRRDSIRVRIAQTHTLLGRIRKADRIAANVVDSETGKVAETKAMAAADSFEEQLKALDALIASSNFDIMKNALDACARLFDRFYDNEMQRSLAEEKIKSSWDTMPIFIRMDLLLKLAGFALDHSDRIRALELLNEAQHYMDNYHWPLEAGIPLMAQLARARYRAGDRDRARSDLDAALALFQAQRTIIVNIDRAAALRPLAETYQSMGDSAAALSVYKKATEEGVENLNSRPRAEDLSANCRSMALHALEPDAELWTRIRHIFDGLGQPW